MEERLRGRVALVTGASSGIGEATAELLAERGARVAVAARRRDRLDQLAARIRGNGGEALVLCADFAEEAQAQRAVADAESHFGRVDILVNNAGVMYLEPIESADLRRWRHMVELNLLGLIAATQAVLPGMRKRRDGHVVNVASTAGRLSMAGAGGYAATKFGVVGFSEALRKETYKDNIRVTVIEPGVVETELREHVQRVDALVLDQRLLERALALDDVDEVVHHAPLAPHDEVEVAQPDIEVDDRDLLAAAGEPDRERGARGGLAHAALAGGDDDDFSQGVVLGIGDWGFGIGDGSGTD
jgi:NADP-dependent 3-hydroxy acid dehydrogenase YdfG